MQMSLIDVLTRLDGRISRKPYWIGTLVLLGAFIAVLVALTAVFGEGVLDGPYSGNSLTLLVLGTLSLIVSVPVMLKRLHDLNTSFKLLVPVFVLEAVSVLGDLAGWTGTEADLNTLGWTLTAIYGFYALALLIFLGFYRGTRGRNDYGPDPLAPEEIPASVNLCSNRKPARPDQG
jgi:uncharacterized membrane protein YhaH (DUF805 family)